MHSFIFFIIILINSNYAIEVILYKFLYSFQLRLILSSLPEMISLCQSFNNFNFIKEVKLNYNMLIFQLINI